MNSKRFFVLYITIGFSILSMSCFDPWSIPQDYQLLSIRNISIETTKLKIFAYYCQDGVIVKANNPFLIERKLDAYREQADFYLPPYPYNIVDLVIKGEDSADNTVQYARVRFAVKEKAGKLPFVELKQGELPVEIMPPFHPLCGNSLVTD